MPNVASRIMQVLHLFTPAQSLWPVEEVAAALRVSPSTAYRYVQELTASGFLDRVHGGYALGPALIEFDYLIRHHDPLIQAATPIMRALLETTTESGTVILCRRCRDHVLCIHQEQGSLPHRRAGYERGVAMPLFRGATSRVILANQTLRVQRRTYEEHQAAIHATSGVGSWQDFGAVAAAIRRAGYAESVGEVTPGIRGIAAPVFQDRRVVAALSLVTEATLDLSAETIRAAVREAAQALSGALAPANLLVTR